MSFDRFVPVVDEATDLVVQTPYMQISTNKTWETSLLKYVGGFFFLIEREKKKTVCKRKTLMFG